MIHSHSPFLPAWAWSLIGFAGAGALSLALIRWFAPLGWMDHPDPRKPHDRPTARTGGLVLGIGCLSLALIHRGPLPSLTAVEQAGCLGMGLLGFVDDRWNLRPRLKAILGFALAMLLAWGTAHELKLQSPTLRFLGLPLSTDPVYTFIPLLLWFWSIPQAFNLSDGVNGLAMGLFGLTMGLVGGVTFFNIPTFWGAFTAVFLLNFPRAKHFLGDCGSLGLGTAIAILMIRWAAPVDAGLALWVGAYWVADVTAVVVIRRFTGRPLGAGDLNHLHHRVLDLTGRRVLIATPALLVLGGLPMLRAVPHPGAQVLSTLGLLVLIAFTAAHIARALREPVRLRASRRLDPASGAYEAESIQP